MRVEADHQRRLSAQSGIAALERPGGMYDGGFSVFGQVDGFQEEAEEGPEEAAPRALMAANDPELGPAIALIKGRKQQKAKGGGGKGGPRNPQRPPGTAGAGGKGGAGGGRGGGGKGAGGGKG